MEQLQEKITNDVLSIIKKYEIDRNYDYAIVILEENMENVRKDISLYIHTLKETKRNIITYTEQEFDIDDHMEIELTFHISNLDFKEIHSFKLPSDVGKILYEEYNNINKIKELVNLGYLESIDSDEVIAFHRDMGYDFYQVKSGATNHLSEFTTREFNYLFDVKSDRWKFFTNLGEFDLEREYNNNFIPE